MNQSSSNSSAKTHSTRYESLDLWRGIACLMVVLDHSALNIQAMERPLLEYANSWDDIFRCFAAFVTSLAWGPPMFFVMSGYCACSSLDSTKRKRLPNWSFIVRRIWRIFPPYWISLAALIAVLAFCNSGELRWLYQDGPAVGLGDPSKLSLSGWIGNLTLTETWRPISPPEDFTTLINTAAWTLCIQEQFYLICFLALALFPRNLHGGIGVLSVAIGFMILFRWDSGGMHTLEGLFFEYWHEFLCGMAVYWAIHTKPEHRQWFAAGLGGTFLICLSFNLYGGMVAAGFALVMIWANRWDRVLAKAPSLKLLRIVGKGSYGIYLGHLPICLMISNVLWHYGIVSFWGTTLIIVPAALSAGLLGGWLFHLTVERRFAGMPKWLDRLAKRHPTAAPLPGPTLAPELALAMLRETPSRSRRNALDHLSGSSLALLKG